MSGEETDRPSLKPQEFLKMISDFTDFIRDEEMSAAERERRLSATESDATLRELMSISSDAAATEKVLSKLQAMLPPIIELYATYATEDEFDKFLQVFDAAMDGVESELAARLQRVNDINAGQG